MEPFLSHAVHEQICPSCLHPTSRSKPKCGQCFAGIRSNRSTDFPLARVEALRLRDRLDGVSEDLAERVRRWSSDLPEDAQFWRELFARHLTWFEGPRRDIAFLCSQLLHAGWQQPLERSIFELFPLTKEQSKAYSQYRTDQIEPALSRLGVISESSPFELHRELARFALVRGGQRSLEAGFSRRLKRRGLMTRGSVRDPIPLTPTDALDSELLLTLVHWSTRHHNPLLEKSLHRERLGKTLLAWAPDHPDLRAWRSAGLLLCGESLSSGDAELLEAAARSNVEIRITRDLLEGGTSSFDYAFVVSERRYAPLVSAADAATQLRVLADSDPDTFRDALRFVDFESLPEGLEVVLRRSLEDEDLRAAGFDRIFRSLGRVPQDLSDRLLLTAADAGCREFAAGWLDVGSAELSAEAWRAVAGFVEDDDAAYLTQVNRRCGRLTRSPGLDIGRLLDFEHRDAYQVVATTLHSLSNGNPEDAALAFREVWAWLAIRLESAPDERVSDVLSFFSHARKFEGMGWKPGGLDLWDPAQYAKDLVRFLGDERLVSDHSFTDWISEMISRRDFDGSVLAADAETYAALLCALKDCALGLKRARAPKTFAKALALLPWEREVVAPWIEEVEEQLGGAHRDARHWLKDVLARGAAPVNSPSEAEQATARDAERAKQLDAQEKQLAKRERALAREAESVGMQRRSLKALTRLQAEISRLTVWFQHEIGKIQVSSNSPEIKARLMNELAEDYRQRMAKAQEPDA